MTDISETTGHTEQISEDPGSLPATPEVLAAPVDPTEAIRAEMHREYAGRLALAELRAQAVKDEINLPEGFTDFLDMSKILGDNGQPAEESIKQVLKPFRAEFPELQGAGYHRGNPPKPPTISLDARLR
jgi:hypothetical protein